MPKLVEEGVFERQSRIWQGCSGQGNDCWED